jgi:hypothetical protein
MRGNILAALIATFVGNPITFPFIAAGSVELGNWMLGHGGEMSPMQIAEAFGNASAELWANLRAIFTDDIAHWDSFKRFLYRVYLPYHAGRFRAGDHGRAGAVLPVAAGDRGLSETAQETPADRADRSAPPGQKARACATPPRARG